MKTKNRIIALLLVLVMTVCLLPTPTMAASGIVRRTATIKERGSVTFTTEITVDIDLSSNTAVVSFKRTDLDVSEYVLEEYPINKQIYADLQSNMSGKARYSVEVKDNNLYDFKLLNPVWEGDPYIIDYWYTGISYSYPDYIAINNENYIALVGIGSVGTISDNGNTDFINVNFYGAEYTAEEEQEEQFVFGEDSFSFNNTRSSFYTTAADTDGGPGFVYNSSNGYQLSPKYYNMLIEDLSPSEIASINSMMNGAFAGNCFGMSAMAALLYAGDLSLSQVQSGATSAYALTAPVKNTALRDAIVYYQLMQKVYAVSLLLSVSGNDSANNAQGLVFDLKSNLPEPVIFVLSGEGWSHAMLSYDMEETSSGYQIMVYDPNDKSKPITMTVSSDYSTITYDREYNGSTLRMSMPLSMNFLKSIEFQSSLEPIVQPELPENGAVITANTDTLTIESGGETAEFKNGQKTSGTLDVQYLGPVNDDGEDTEVIFFMNPPTAVKAPITVYSDRGVRFTCRTVTSGSVDDGVFVDVQSEAQTRTTITYSNGSVEVDNIGGGRFKCSVTSDKTDGALFTTTVESTSENLTITPAVDGAKVETSDGATADITASGATEFITFENADTSEPVELTARGLDCSLTSDGETIASGTAVSAEGSAEEAEIDTTPITESIRNACTSISAQIIDAMKNNDTTIEKFTELGYAHSAWARNELARAQELGMIPDDIKDKLSQNITRGEFADLVYETVKAVTGMTDTQMEAFSRLPDSDNPYQYEYADRSVQFVYGCGIVNGYTDGSFKPDSYISRSEAAKMLVYTAELMGKELSESGAKYFNDSPNDWSQSYINKISSISSPYSGYAVMSGDQNGNFMPSGYYTCEQAVATMLRITESTVGEVSAYSGGVIATAQSEAVTAADGDITGFVPNEWSWTVEGEGYGQTYFAAGKYVRSDGQAVLYIDRADSPDYFSYQLYTLPDGSKQNSYMAPGPATQEYWGNMGISDMISYATAENSSDTEAADYTEGLYFNAGNGTITVTSDWLDELYYEYSMPDGVYTLVREKS